MKRAFTFRLARVQRVREVFEEEARGALAEAFAEVTRRDAQCQELVRQLEDGQRAQLAAQTAGHLDVAALLARERSLGVLQGALVVAREAAAEARRRADARQAAWQARRGELRALEQLSERHRERHLAALAKDEGREADEANAARFGATP